MLPFVLWQVLCCHVNVCAQTHTVTHVLYAQLQSLSKEHSLCECHTWFLFFRWTATAVGFPFQWYPCGEMIRVDLEQNATKDSKLGTRRGGGGGREFYFYPFSCQEVSFGTHQPQPENSKAVLLWSRRNSCCQDASQTLNGQRVLLIILDAEPQIKCQSFEVLIRLCRATFQNSVCRTQSLWTILSKTDEETKNMINRCVSCRFVQLSCSPCQLRRRNLLSHHLRQFMNF